MSGTVILPLSAFPDESGSVDAELATTKGGLKSRAVVSRLAPRKTAGVRPAERLAVRVERRAP